MLSNCSETPLPASCAEQYHGIAFDGRQYCLTTRRQCRITILDHDFGLIRSVKTCRPYTAICYDPKRNCFWAAAEQHRAAIFKLDMCLREIDMRTLKLEGCGLGVIAGLSYCCGNGLLMAASGGILLEIDPANGAARLLREEGRDALILSMVCLSPYIILCVLRGCRPVFDLCSCTGQLLAEEQQEVSCMIDAMLLDPCGCTPDQCGLLLLTNKHGCYPHLLRAPLGRDICRRLSPCNREICRMCKETCGPCCKNACNDVMESIALQEAAIARILNAEGEKLQRAIHRSNTPGELLEVNESVHKTIVYATHLEQVLFSKLDALQGICGCKTDASAGFNWSQGEPA